MNREITLLTELIDPKKVTYSRDNYILEVLLKEGSKIKPIIFVGSARYIHLFFEYEKREITIGSSSEQFEEWEGE